jgi:hypothetical protein
MFALEYDCNYNKSEMMMIIIIIMMTMTMVTWVPTNPFFIVESAVFRMRLRLAMRHRKGPNSLVVGTFARRCPAVPTLLLAPWTVQYLDHPCCAVYLQSKKYTKVPPDWFMFIYIYYILINGKPWWIPQHLPQNSPGHVGKYIGTVDAIEYKACTLSGTSGK